jgi:hypothetical protein
MILSAEIIPEKESMKLKIQTGKKHVHTSCNVLLTVNSEKKSAGVFGNMTKGKMWKKEER